MNHPMKQLFSLLLALIMVVSVLPVSALAQTEKKVTPISVPSGQIDIQVEYHVSPLLEGKVDPKELFPEIGTSVSVPFSTTVYTDPESAAQAVLQGLRRRASDIYVTVYSETPYEGDLSGDILSMALASNGVPEEGDYLAWSLSLGHGHGYIQEDNGYYYNCYFGFLYDLSAEQEAELDIAVDALLDELNLYDAADYEKVRGIYDWMCANITYDHENLEDDSYHLKHTAYAALINRTSVCEGYALLFYRLAVALGLQCRIIASATHAWNIVKLGEYYYNLDATWDAGMALYGYDYFLLTDESFRHQDWGHHIRMDHTYYFGKGFDYTSAEFYEKHPMGPVDYFMIDHTHEYQAAGIMPPTCVDYGWTSYVCSCGDVQYDDHTEPLGHDWQFAGCETPSTCSRCGETNGEAPGHTWDDGVVIQPPTMTTEGEMLYTCTICGATKTEPIPVVEHWHAYTSRITPPTCTEQGYTTWTCNCGDSYVDTYVDALGHNYHNGRCLRCGESDPDFVSSVTALPNGVVRLSGTNRYETGFAIADQLRINHSVVANGIVTSNTLNVRILPTTSATVMKKLYNGDKVNIIAIKTVNGIKWGRIQDGWIQMNYVRITAGRTDDTWDNYAALFHTAIVAYGQNFPDALTGSYLASVKNAPILLTEPGVDGQVIAWLRSNLVPGGKVYILGGTAAVSQAFEDGAKSFGFEVQRLMGAGRYETNLEILKEAGVNTTDEVLIATGKNYADSLSASATGLPMLLVDKTLTEDQKAFLENTSKNFVILGGTSAVSAEIETELAEIGTVIRVKGSNRYETSVEIAKRYFENPRAVVLAYAQGFPDGLCGGPLALSMGAPLILTSNESYGIADDYIEGISTGAVTGGTSRISDETVREIFDLPGDAQIVIP